MTRAELQWLFDRAQEAETIVEVGSWLGRSTHALCTGCTGTVYSVDHFMGTPGEEETTYRYAQNHDVYLEFLHNMRAHTNLRILKGYSHEIAQTFAPASVDMIFIDADHRFDGVRQDIVSWLPVARKIICGHDYTLEGVKRAVDSMNFKVTLGPHSLWSVVRGT